MQYLFLSDSCIHPLFTEQTLLWRSSRQIEGKKFSLNFHFYGKRETDCKEAKSKDFEVQN